MRTLSHETSNSFVFDVFDSDGNHIGTDEVAKTQPPLDASGVLATLLAVQAIIPLADAANAVNLPPEALITEAIAWAVAQEMTS